MKKAEAIKEINRIFGFYSAPSPASSVSVGKVYEIFCLAQLIDSLKSQGLSITYVGLSTAVFKGAPGGINSSDPHFEVSNGREVYEIFLNIEFKSMSSTIGSVMDLSDRHEVDIVIVEPGLKGYPSHNEVVTAIECKAVANFKKSILKEVLGIRRELCYFQPSHSRYQNFVSGVYITVNSDTGSEYWVRYIDKKGDKYSEGARFFGVNFASWAP